MTIILILLKFCRFGGTWWRCHIEKGDRFSFWSFVLEATPATLPLLYVCQLERQAAKLRCFSYFLMMLWVLCIATAARSVAVHFHGRIRPRIAPPKTLRKFSRFSRFSQVPDYVYRVVEAAEEITKSTRKSWNLKRKLALWLEVRGVFDHDQVGRRKGAGCAMEDLVFWRLIWLDYGFSKLFTIKKVLAACCTMLYLLINGYLVVRIFGCILLICGHTWIWYMMVLITSYYWLYHASSFPDGVFWLMDLTVYSFSWCLNHNHMKVVSPMVTI